MRLATPLVLTLFLPALAHGQPRSATAKTKAELTGMYRKVIGALQTRDTVVLSGIYGPGYHFVMGAGDSVITLNRAERLRSVAVSADSIRTLTLERCDFDLFGAMAIGGCWVRQNSGGRADEWVGIYSTQVFNRDGRGRWWLVRSHASVNRPTRRR